MLHKEELLEQAVEFCEYFLCIEVWFVAEESIISYFESILVSDTLVCSRNSVGFCNSVSSTKRIIILSVSRSIWYISQRCRIDWSKQMNAVQKSLENFRVFWSVFSEAQSADSVRFFFHWGGEEHRLSKEGKFPMGEGEGMGTGKGINESILIRGVCGDLFLHPLTLKFYDSFSCYLVMCNMEWRTQLTIFNCPSRLG